MRRALASLSVNSFADARSQALLRASSAWTLLKTQVARSNRESLAVVTSMLLATGFVSYDIFSLRRQNDLLSTSLAQARGELLAVAATMEDDVKRAKTAQEELAKERSEGLEVATELMCEVEGEWNVSLHQQNVAMASILADGAFLEFHRDSRERNLLLLFLYCAAPQIFHPEIRLAAFLNLLDAPPSSDPGRRRLNRLMQIVLLGETHFGRLESTSFDDFVLSHPEWADPKTSFVFFRDDERVKAKDFTFVERIQPFGLCSRHSSVVLSHYLLAMTRDDAMPVLDLGAYLRKFLRGNDLHCHVWRSSGTDSELFLKNLLDQNSSLLGMFMGKINPESGSEEAAQIAEEIAKHLRLLGPALVSKFHANQDFTDFKQWQHVGIPQASFVGLHSMVLVGFRKQNGEHRFLLQNWWGGKQFVEVDTDYLRWSKAEVFFVPTPQHKIPHGYPFHFQQGPVECGLLDTEELENSREIRNLAGVED